MAIRYTEAIKKPREKFEYTPEILTELSTCSSDIWHFLPYIKIVHPDRGLIEFNPYIYQKTALDLFMENRFIIALWSRQSGKTVNVSAYTLWYALFHPDKNIGIVSNKQVSAIDILTRIKRMYEELPVWIKPGVLEYSKTFITFDNGTKIMVSATSADAFRGRALNLLVMDEFAFVPKAVADDFWAANYPTISASTEAKIIIISTPNGIFNLFHTIYSQAERGENTFKHMKSTWRDVPGRNAEWAVQEQKNIGLQRFNQEYAVDFLGSSNTVIDPNILEILFTRVEEPMLFDLNNRLSIYEKPIKGATYIIGCDTAKGTGENSSCMQVLRIVSLTPLKYKQVAVFNDDHTDVYSFSEIINRISLYYNNAYIMCENNSEGSAVVNRLWWEFENEGLVNSGSKANDIGIRATKSTKPRAVLLMKKLLEDDCLEICDRDTINELGSFIEEKGKFFGKNLPDDRVCALYWGSFFAEMDILEEGHKLLDISDVERAKNENITEEEIWGIVSDVDAQIANWDWLSSPGNLRG